MVHSPESSVGIDKNEHYPPQHNLENIPSDEAPKKTLWEKIKGKVFSHVAESLLVSTGMTVKPYGLEQNVRSVRDFKFNGRITDAEVYQSALKVAEQFGWRPGKTKSPIITPYRGEEAVDIHQNSDAVEEVSVPLFITNKLKRDLRDLGVTDDELYKLKPAEAWGLLQKKTVEKKLKTPAPEQAQITLEEASGDFNVLSNMWDEAYEKMQGTSTPDMVEEIENVTTRFVGDAESLQEYLDKNKQRLSEDEVRFVEMSIMMKKIRTKVVEGLTDEYLPEDLVTDEVFDIFVETGEVSEEIITAIADKIASTESMTQRELSIYVEKSTEIETMLRGRVV